MFGYHADYLAIMIGMQGAPPGYRDAEGRWESLWRQRLENYTPWGLDWLTRQSDDEYWAVSSPREFYDRIEVPVFVIGGWGDRYPGDALKVFQNVRGPRKALIGPWHHVRLDMAVPGPRVDYHAVLRWFDYWLKGERNGILDEPALTFYTQLPTTPADYIPMMPGRWRQENAFPIPGSSRQKFYLCSQGALSSAELSEPMSETYPYDPTAGVCSQLTGGIYGGIGLPLDQRPDEPKSVVFTTEPLKYELEIAGISRVRFDFSSSARVMGLMVKLCNVDPEGTVALITRGQLNAVHREGLDRPKYLDPGVVSPIEIEMKATAYAFQPGHRIRLAITSGEFQTVLSTPERGVNTIHFGGHHSSHLELPVIPARREPDPSPFRPCLPPPPNPPSEASFHIGETEQSGQWLAVREACKEVRGLEGKVTYWLKTSSRIRPDQPAQAEFQSESAMSFDYDSGEVIESRGSIHYRGDPKNIHLNASLRVTRNGKIAFAKDWKRSHPRKFF